MVLIIDRYKLNLSAQDFKGIEKLDTFAYRYIGIEAAVKQQQRCMYLVGVEKRTVLCIQIRVGPGITLVGRYGVV